MARICLVLTGATIEENLAHLARYRNSIDLAELRVDLLDENQRGAVDRFPSLSPVPVICTVRRRSDGGQFAGSETERKALYRRAADAGFAFADLESDVRDNELKAVFSNSNPVTRIIRSYHDFKSVPEHLDELFADLSRDPDEIPKIAVNPQSVADAIRLAQAAKSWGARERIVLGMGSFGFFTRVIAEKLGSYLTFASPTGTSAAPGHIDPETLLRVYRFRVIGSRTRLFGVIGDPVMHSRSPHIHNPALAHHGIDAVYLPFHVDDVRAFIDGCANLDVDGFSVTVPHKQTIIPQLNAEDDAVHAIGSCNTVIRTDARLEGVNTDAPGFLAAVKQLVGALPRRATVVGAGGTARAVVYALTNAGVDVLVVNRTVARAESLAATYGCRSVPLDSDASPMISESSQLIVQTTSAGMEPNEHLDPLSFYEFSGSEAVMDVIYAPRATRLLSRAAASGCATTNGWDMLLEQAYLQFELFTGRPYPRELAPALD